MASKSDSTKKTSSKTALDPERTAVKKSSSKAKKDEDDDDDEVDEELETKPASKTKKATTKSKVDDEEDEDEDVEVADDWEKPEEEDEWDPDFDEFDVPKSKGVKKVIGKKGKADDDEFKLDDDFKDLGFDDLSGGGYDDEEDDF